MDILSNSEKIKKTSDTDFILDSRKQKNQNQHSDKSILLTRIEEAEKRVNEGAEKLEKINNLMIFGFMVLLIMVATVILMIAFEMIRSYHDLSTKIYDLEFQNASLKLMNNLRFK